MPTKNRSKNANGHAMLNYKPSTPTDGAKLELKKRTAAKRAQHKAVVKHVCPICAWDSAASRAKKKSSRDNLPRSH